MHCPLEIFAAYEEHVFIELLILFNLINIATIPRATGQWIKEPGFVCVFLLIEIFHYLLYGFLAFRQIFTFLVISPYHSVAQQSLHSYDYTVTSLSISYHCFKQLGRIFCTSEGRKERLLHPSLAGGTPKLVLNTVVKCTLIAPFSFETASRKALALPLGSCFTPTCD